MNEVEVFSIQNERELYPVGWIHVYLSLLAPSMFSDLFIYFVLTYYNEVMHIFQTHPSQGCFMSSVDLHTHYSYQVMVPEAFAIVVAPTDSSKYVLPKLWSQLYSQHISLIDSQTDLFGRSYGIFKLTDPGGMEVLRGCSETGFHPHKEPEDGNPVYEHCSNVYKNSNLRFEIFDLR
jgi:STAM-binding protein